ncbi:hypothetical protein RND81_02G157700 [Saponaria officinalis]|uniref:FHA domain-containing protein n=1 Tax=Saponaria officinalis TaxID=3572 RepID=A0AAW1MLV0_SAPOF
MADAFNLLEMYQDDDTHQVDIAVETHSISLPTHSSIGLPDNTIDESNLNDVVHAESSPPKWTTLRPPTPLVVGNSASTTEVPRRMKPAIVDYAHDDIAMSPDHEVGAWSREHENYWEIEAHTSQDGGFRNGYYIFGNVICTYY